MVLAIATAFRTMLEFDLEDPADIQAVDLSDRLNRINAMLCDITPEGMYATGVAMLYDKRSRILQLHDYGHSLVWLKRKNKVYNLAENIVFDAADSVPFFGIDRNVRLNSKNFLLRPGDLLFVCSDGINEAKNPQKEELGVDRINQYLLQCEPEDGPEAALRLLKEQWTLFRDGYRKLDDVSMLAAVIE